MNNFETDNIEINSINPNNPNNPNNQKFIPMDLNQISNIISQKINCIKEIDDTTIEELCNGLKLYCQNHNKMINNWFDKNYIDDMEKFKATKKKYLEFANIFCSNSFILIKNIS
jgi:hypothetical protein